MLVFHQKQNQANMKWNIWMLKYCCGDSLQIQLLCESYDILCFSFDEISRNSGSHEHSEWPTVLVRYLSVLTNKTAPKKKLRALSPPTCHQLGGQWIKRRSESNDSSDTGRADILEQWLYISTDLGWNQVHSFGAYSKVQLIPLCLERWEGASFLRGDW